MAAGSQKLRLTQTVKKGGCAAKVAAHELRDILSRVKFPAPQKNVLINGSDFDDAAVYDLGDGRCLIETTDFFTPIVDDPHLFGQIAAANAMSDVYAMGGQPKTALAILAFPLLTLENPVIAEILQGAIDTLARAGADLVGGHSIDDETLKFGLALTGLGRCDELWTNKGARVGDHLILTKSLGTGTLMAALKQGKIFDADLTQAYESMTQLNNIRDLLGTDTAAIHAATDVTGFGLAGHACQMARASALSFKIHAQRLPVLPHAFESLGRGCLTKAHGTNRKYVQDDSHMDSALDEGRQLIFFDPQTSGGLLLSVDPRHSSALLEKIKTRFSHAAIIGEVMARQDHVLFYEL